MKNPLFSFIVFLSCICSALYPGSTLNAQCSECGAYSVVIYNSEVKIAAPDDAAAANGWLYLRNQAVITLSQSIRENEVSPDCIRLLDGSFVQTATGETPLNSQNTAPSGSLPLSVGAHYLIRSEVTQSAGLYNITYYLETGVSREVVTSFSRTFNDFSELGLSKYDPGKIAGMQGFSPLSSIIRSFETKKREDNDNVALDANTIEVLPHGKSVKKGEKITVAFRLTDCDGEVLAGRKIQLGACSAMGESLPASTLGAFSESEVTTDETGVAKATFVAGKQKGKALIRAYHIYTAPFGEERYASGEATIEVTGDPVTQLTGEVEIISTTKTGVPTISNPESARSFATAHCLSSITMTIIPERIININESSSVFSVASESDLFEVAYGKTLTDAGGEPTMVRSESVYSFYDKCDDKLEISRKGKIKGYSNGYDIHVGIALERGVRNGDTEIASLKPGYCIVTDLTGNNRMIFQNAKYNTSGNDAGQKRDYPCAELTSFNETLDSRSFLPCETMRYTTKVMNGEAGETIIPLSINDTEALEKFLLDPTGTFTINASGKYYIKDYEEREVSVTVKLTLWAEEE